MRKFIFALCVAGILAVAGGAYATPEYYEAFDYPADHFTYQHGWTTQPSSLPYIINAPGATFTDDGGNALRVNGNLIYQVVDYARYDSIAKSLGSAVTNLMAADGTYYITTLISQENLLGFRQAGVTNPYFAIHGEPAGGGAYSPTLEASDSVGNSSFQKRPAFITDTDYHLYALRIVNRPGPDEITLLIDPDLNNPSWETARGNRLRIDNIDFQTQHNQVFIWGGAKGPNTGAYTQYWIGGIDEIRIASAWSEAAPYDYIPQPGSGTLSGQVELQDFQAGSSPVAIVIDLVQNSVVVRSETVVLDENGNYSVHSVDPGTYSVVFKAASRLTETVTNVVVADGIKVCDVSLTNGDVNGDNDLTDADMSLVLSNLDVPGDN